MFSPRHAPETKSHAADPPAAPPLAQRLAEAFAPARAPAPAQEYRAEPVQTAPTLQPQPQPQLQPQFVQHAPAAQHYPEPAQHWQPQPLAPHPGFVPAGPMMYPQPVFAPQSPFAPLTPALQAWPQPSPYFAFQQPVHLQMPVAPQPQTQFYAPPAAIAPPSQPVSAVHPAAQQTAHPFAQEAEEFRATPKEPPRAPAGDRMSQIQESIDEFRSALTSYAKTRRAS